MFDNHVRPSGSLGVSVIYLMFTIVVAGCEHYIRAMLLLLKIYECNKMTSKIICVVCFVYAFHKEKAGNNADTQQKHNIQDKHLSTHTLT